MSSSTPLTDAINALTTYANETTGASDTTLSEAVATLVAGYGSGGSSCEMGTFTSESETNTFSVSVSATYTYLAIWPATTKANFTYGSTRTLWVAWGDTSTHTIIDTNSSGSGLTLLDRASQSKSYITFTSSTITAKFLGNGANCVMPAGQSYNWLAW